MDDSKQLQTLFDEATKLSQERNWREVLAVRRKIRPLLSRASDGEKKAEIYYLLGSASSRTGMHMHAISDFTRALDSNPRSAEAYNGRGSAYASRDRFKRAIADFDQAIEINPQFAKAYFNRGTAKHSMGEDYADAIADFDRAIKINPQFAAAYSNRSNAKNKTGDHEGAIADCDRVIEINPLSARAFNARGIAKRNIRNYESAIADFDRAIELDSKFVEAYGNRGNAKSDKGDHESAIADFDQALKIDPENKDVIHNRAFTLALQSAEKGFEAKLQAHLDREEELRNRGSRIIHSPEYEEVLEKYEDKAWWRGFWVWGLSCVLGGAAIAIYGYIACLGMEELQTTQSPMAMRVFSPLSLFPFILMGTLVLSPLAWAIRMLNRDKHKYWVLREEAAANLNLLRIIETGHRKRDDLWLQLFDHYDKRGSAHLIADWNRADTSGGNSIVSLDSVVKPSGGGN